MLNFYWQIMYDTLISIDGYYSEINISLKMNQYIYKPSCLWSSILTLNFVVYMQRCTKLINFIATIACRFIFINKTKCKNLSM
jgi:hypothetical protein